MKVADPLQAPEWLEPDGLGGFASGTVSGLRTRRYHAALLAAASPPTHRHTLASGYDVHLTHPNLAAPLSSQLYMAEVLSPRGVTHLNRFENEPWPTWFYRPTPDVLVRHELFVRHGLPLTVMAWHLETELPGPWQLAVRPFLSGRNFHDLQQANADFRFEAERIDPFTLQWHPYPSVPGVVARSNGRFVEEPHWYFRFLYTAERARGHGCVEDLAAPGVFLFDLAAGPALLVLGSTHRLAESFPPRETPEAAWDRLRNAETKRRDRFASPVHRAADGFLVHTGERTAVIGGYPWLAEGGRDSLIALRGIGLANGRLSEVADALSDFAGSLSDGMLPSKLDEFTGSTLFKSADTSLWFCVVAHDLLQLAASAPGSVSPAAEMRFKAAIHEILEAYSHGTRCDIRQDSDGLLCAGSSQVAVTWMDAAITGRPVTPRAGKAVEIQALWINALWIGAQFSKRWRAPLDQARASFEDRFWNPDAQCLFDVVDCDGNPGSLDTAIRPNQIFAAAGLPLPLLEGERLRAVVATVERHLWTPAGLRTLCESDARYILRAPGAAPHPETFRHQGPVWPWLAPTFIEAWLRSQPDAEHPDTRMEARTRFFDPLVARIGLPTLGHLSEFADPAAPHTPRGCPCHALAISELLRIQPLFRNPDPA